MLITGWGASTGYMFSIYFVFVLILVPVFGWDTFRFAIVAILLMTMAFGIYNLCRNHGPDFGNPYLTISLWQPLWTLVLPAFSIAVLHSPDQEILRRANRATSCLISSAKAIGRFSRRNPTQPCQRSNAQF